MDTVQEPQGIGFFNVKSGDTHYLKNEPGIAAYINSSDMGINASRGQDFGWKLAPDWVKRVKAFRRDDTKMSILTSKNGGQKPTTVQILYYMYSEELRAYEEDLEEHENPFEEQYQNEISGRNTTTPTDPTPAPEPTNDVPETVDDADLAPADEPELDPDAAAEAATSDTHTVSRDAGDGQFVSQEEAKENPGTTVTETVKNKPGAKPKQK